MNRLRRPSLGLFGTIRLRLTLLYTAVLAAMLLVSSTALYVGVSNSLLGSVNDTLQNGAYQIGLIWQRGGLQRPDFACPAQIASALNVPYLTCYLRQQHLLIHTHPGDDITNFNDPDKDNPVLIQAALTNASHTATDTIDAGPGLGAVRRYALAVTAPTSADIIGVVQVGVPIQGQLQSLDVLRSLLLVFGALTLIGAGLGGLYLAGRALAPARLAFERQQTFIADASHELRTPLTLMRADAEVLLRGRDRLPPDDAVLLDDIVAETAHMNMLASSMLTLARLDAGKARIEHEVVDLAEVAAHTVQRMQAFAVEKQVTLTAEATVPVYTIGDRALLEQACVTLVDNAIKYNRDQGTVTVQASLAGGRALLAIRDTGMGIAAEHVPHLGERFYRVDKARSREAGGAGLGISIARDIAVTHHGTLTYTSVPEQGTTATLSLPAAQSSAESPSAAHPSEGHQRNPS